MDVKERRHTAQLFADGTHPVMRAALYEGHQKAQENPPPSVTRNPLFPFPKTLSPRQLAGDASTEELLTAREHTGESIKILDGFNVTIHTAVGPMLVLVDTKSDPLLAGIIHKAQTLFTEYPRWNTDRQVFELGLLCFGDWGQKRYPLEAFKKPFFTPQFLLGELIWTTDASDQECLLKSLPMQAAGQQCGINISWHGGYCARFSPYCHGADSHSWNLVQNGTKQLVVDWTNYPPRIARLFASAKTGNRDELYEQFCKTCGVFPEFTHEIYPPNQDQYFDLQSGDHPELAVRNSAVYWNYMGAYLGTCSLPGGWEK